MGRREKGLGETQGQKNGCQEEKHQGRAIEKEDKADVGGVNREMIQCLDKG